MQPIRLCGTQATKPRLAPALPVRTLVGTTNASCSISSKTAACSQGERMDISVVQDDMLWTVSAVSDMCEPTSDEMRAGMAQAEYYDDISVGKLDPTLVEKERRPVRSWSALRRWMCMIMWAEQLQRGMSP